MADAIDSPALPATIDWSALAKSALAAHGKGMRKLNRMRLRAMLADLADATPLDTVCRRHGFNPDSIRQLATSRPGLWAVIEQARAEGETKCLKKIGDSNQWQAQDRLLQYARPSQYTPQSPGAGPGQSGGPTINVVINVPRPELAQAGGSLPIIDAIAVQIATPTPAALPKGDPTD